MKKLVMVEALSQHVIKYVVEVEDHLYHALDEVVCREENDPSFEEFSQRHIGISILNHYEISKEQYLETFDKDNDYLKDLSEDEKLKYINTINYEENE
jgi:hypothetical protein